MWKQRGFNQCVPRGKRPLGNLSMLVTAVSEVEQLTSPLMPPMPVKINSAGGLHLRPSFYVDDSVNMNLQAGLCSHLEEPP